MERRRIINDDMEIMSFEEMLASLDINDEPYKFPCEEYDIIGDTTEIDKILYSAGIMNIDVRDIEETLSKETTNYVSTGRADGQDCIVNALADALHNLPIEIDAISELLINVWMPKDMWPPVQEMESMADFINVLSEDIDFIWGLALDESMDGRQARVSLIAASK